MSEMIPTVGNNLDAETTNGQPSPSKSNSFEMVPFTIPVPVMPYPMMKTSFNLTSTHGSITEEGTLTTSQESIKSISDSERLEKALEHDINGGGERSFDDLESFSNDEESDFAASFSSMRPITSRMILSRPKTGRVTKPRRPQTSLGDTKVLDPISSSNPEVTAATEDKIISTASSSAYANNFSFRPAFERMRDLFSPNKRHSKPDMAEEILDSPEDIEAGSRPYISAFFSGLFSVNTGQGTSQDGGGMVEDNFQSPNHDNSIKFSLEATGEVDKDSVTPSGLCFGRCCCYCRCVRSDKYANLVENHKLARIVTILTLITIVALIIVYIIKSKM